MSMRKELVVKPFLIQPREDIRSVLSKMENASFQARNLGSAFRVWKQMLREETFIFMGLAGAMIPAGMRRLLCYLIQHRLIDCLVSTGANLFHDCYESLGRVHFQCSPLTNDIELKKRGMSRVYDTLVLDKDFKKTDHFTSQFAESLKPDRLYTTREFFYLLGEKLSLEVKEKGILISAYEAKIPVYCPAPGDSSVGIALAIKKTHIGFDLIKDVEEMAFLVSKAKLTGVIYIGGGTPKNFIQQAQVTASLKGVHTHGHKYAVQITTDSPYWGGLSGCSFEEGQSWGKIAPKAEKVTLHCDATIALPLLATGLAQEIEEGLKRDRVPVFEQGKEITFSFK